MAFSRLPGSTRAALCPRVGEQVTTLVVAALAQEARYVPSEVEVLITGLGKTAAAVRLTHRLTAGDVTGVLNIGTAGALRDRVTGLHEVAVVRNHDLNAEIIRSLGVDPDEEIRIGSGDVVLASGDIFVTDPLLRDALGSWASLVDMEGYAIAYACREMDVPLRMAKCVSDNADESALDWSAAVDSAAQLLGEWVRRVLCADSNSARAQPM